MLLISIVFPNVLFSQPAAITNIQVSQRTDGSGLTDIYFTLAGTASAYYVSVEASFNGGSTFTPIPAVSVSGDTGPMTAGSGKHIIWNGLQSFPNTYSTQSKLKLIAATTPPLGLPCPGTPTVFYGGQTYNTVQIGTQCWMAQNLNIGTKINGSGNQTNNSTIEKYCYNDLESNCNIYGGLYQWAEMVQYLNGATNTSSWNPVPTGNVTGICPTGWHIPTDAEWTTLTTYVNSQSSYLCNSTSGYIAKAMAATTLWNSSSYTCAIGNNLSLNNATGFTAGPAGYRTNDGAFTSIGYFSSWWSSSEGSTSNAWSRDLAYNYSNVYRSYHGKNYGFSVRCLRD
jgi:uncharacterized protein (TIGR02145 family)